MMKKTVATHELPAAMDSIFGTPEDQYRIEDLSVLISMKRKQERLTLEQAARQIGVSIATLSRWERQQMSRVKDCPMSRIAPDIHTLSAIVHWLGISLDQIVDVQPQLGESTLPSHTVSTPDKVEAHLRADRKLEPKMAAALGQMFRLAYEQVTGTPFDDQQSSDD